MCRLAVGSLSPGGSSSETQNKRKSHVPPGGYEQPARRPKTQKNTNKTMEMHAIHVNHYTVHAQT